MILKLLAYLILGSLLISCSTTKLVTKKNKIYEFKEVNSGSGSLYRLYSLEPKGKFKAELTEKTDYVIITPSSNPEFKIDSVDIDPAKASPYFDRIGKKFYPGGSLATGSIKPFRYNDIKFGIQALTIPLKFRRSVGNDTINPPTVETGVNIGLAAGWKFSTNIYKESKNYLGKNTSTFSMAVGPLFNIGATDLKKASNAPGLLSDRKRPTASLGGFLMLGFNNINVGYAFGWDSVIGDGRENWVYQKELWHGVIVSLDVLKF